jgi:hypothetical protein
MQRTLVFIKYYNPSTFTNQTLFAIHLGKQHQSHPFATKRASTLNQTPQETFHKHAHTMKENHQIAN